MEPTADTPGERFAFGRNWRNFVEDVGDARIEAAVASLREMLGGDRIEGRSFLDVGCGSGLFSLAALRLGATYVHSFDYDAESVAAAETLQAQFGAAAAWTVERGDATDAAYMGGLGSFDIVYAWGVLHHTGAMWQAMENALERVAPGGSFFVAIYNDQGRKSRRWLTIKRIFNRLPRTLRAPYAIVVMSPYEARALAGAAARGRLGEHLRAWRHGYDRGMSRWHDLLDWVGGYPFEVATPEQVFHFCHDRGFDLRALTTCLGGLGCNEFVFERAHSRSVPRDRAGDPIVK